MDGDLGIIEARSSNDPDLRSTMRSLTRQPQRAEAVGETSNARRSRLARIDFLVGADIDFASVSL